MAGCGGPSRSYQVHGPQSLALDPSRTVLRRQRDVHSRKAARLRSENVCQRELASRDNEQELLLIRCADLQHTRAPKAGDATME